MQGTQIVLSIHLTLSHELFLTPEFIRVLGGLPHPSFSSAAPRVIA